MEDMEFTPEEVKQENPGHDALIDRWFFDHFPGSPEVAGHTPAWNLVTRAVADLKRRFKEV